MKKFILLILVNASNLPKEYLSKYTPDIFIGINTSFNYTKASSSIDTNDYAYGAYIGNRFFNDYELIFKTNKLDANDYKIKKNSIRLNIPLDSLFSRRLYFGLTYGKTKFEFKEKTIDNIDVSNKSDTSNYYSVTFGKRYKFARFFYVRTEIEYIKYSNKIKISQDKDFTLNNAFGFNYFVEYNF